MLLKSVGENGTNYSKAVTMEANPQNYSGDLIKQVDSTSKIFGNNNSRMQNITDFDQSMVRDNIEINLLGQDKDESEVVRQSTDSVSNALVRNELLRKFDSQRESSSFLSNAVEQKERYSFLKPAGDSLLLINDGCQVTGISNNRDGLLDAFASQVNDFNTTSKAVELEREYIAAGNQNEQESEDNQAANESFTAINSKVAFKSTEVENTEGNNSNLDTQTSENETVIVENYIRVNILEDDEEFGATLIPHENAVTSRSVDTLHNLAKAYSDTTLVAFALEKDAASSVSTDFTNLKNNANALEGKLEDTKNSGDNGSGFGMPSVEDSTNKIQSRLDGSHSKNVSCELKEATSPESQAHDSVVTDVKEMKVSADEPSFQVHALKDAVPADLVLEWNAVEISNQISSERMKLKETEANVSLNATFTQIEDNTDNRQLKDQDSCLNMKEVSNQILSGCMKARKREANNSSNSDFTQLEGNADNRNSKDPDLVVNAKEISNQTSSACMKVQFHGIKDILTSDLLLKQNAREVSNPTTSECMKLKEIEANRQLECIVDDQPLEYPDLCVASEVINQVSSECMKSKQTQDNISSNSVFIQLEGNQDNRQLEDQDLCINAKEVLNQLPSECMESKDTEANMSSKYFFTQLESNADNRQLEDPDMCANAEASNQISSVCMKLEEVEANISSNSYSTQLKGDLDYVPLEYSDCVNERDASNQNLLVSGETKANISSNSNFAQPEGYVDNRQLEGPELCLNVNDVSNQISLGCMQSKEPDANVSLNSSVTQPKSNADNMQLKDPDVCVSSSLNFTPRTFKGVQSACHLESSDTSDASQCDLQPQSLPEKPITQGDSTVIEEKIVSENGKNMSDKPYTSSDERKQSVFRNSGVLPSHNEESMLPAPSSVTQKLTGKDLLSMEIAKTSSVKPRCCSPTIVSDVPFHTEVEGINSPVQISTLPVHRSLISSETRGKIDTIKNITLDPDKPTTIENDTSFSFEVGNTVDMSEKVTSNQSKLSHGVLSSGTRKTAKEIDVGTKDEKSTKPRAKSTKRASTHKSCSDSIGISYTASSMSIGTGYSIFRIDEVAPKAKSSSRQKKPDSPFIQKYFLPDLNTSVSASALVCQPFSDLQQVQLHAQIFVYSSLSENKPPVETYMKSAFREMDGGRRTWETAWRKSVDRYQTQKSFLNPEILLPSHSVPRVPEQETKCPLVQSKVMSTSASKSTSKFISSATPSTSSPLPFPLRNLTSKSPGTANLSFNQALTPLDPNPSSQTRQFAYSSTPRIFSNTRPAPWVICSPSPALKLRHSLSVSAVDTVKVTPVRETSMLYTALFSSPMPVNIPLDPQGKTASVQKSRKWKKARQGTEDNSESILVSQPALTPVVHRSPPITLPYVSPTTKTHAMVAIEKIVAAVPHNFSPHNYQMINSVSSAEIAKVSEEVGSKIEQAKLQAEEAASLAASVVSHSQIIWNQLAAQENSSLSSELEAKLVAAAAAGSAATSVARAAAVVAKVACETALQAELMADEAIDSAKTEIIFDAGKNLPVLNLGSTPEHKDKVHGSSLTAASDHAQIIVDETSVITKRAKNHEAIMRAAGLAAEAVSHVGTLIAMGDPLPFNLSNLLEAGPDSSWKAYVKTNKLKDLEQSENAPSAIKKMQQTVFKEGEHRTVHPVENCYGSGLGKSSTFPKGSQEDDPDNQKENSFRKGSLVEVIFDEGRLKGGWFSARVLDVEDNKVHVSYNNLPSDDGSAQLKEWVSLDSETNRAPRIRNAHPRSVTQNVGTKKRRREVASDHVWEVDDHVDAWMHDGWWGGIITEKTRLDETKLKVHFPDGCHSSVVPAWNLRTSLSWKDGQWKEWSRAKEGNLKQHEGDTLQEKRQKLDKNEANTNTKVDGKVPSTLSEKLSLKNRKIAEELRPLNLFIKDVSFVTKRKRTGPQKFMKVSKYYYGSDKADKPNYGMDSLKFPKYLMPQAARPWRNASITVPRGKQAVDSTSVGVKPFRFLTANSRNAKQKDINTTVNTASYSEKRKSSSVKKGYIGVKRRLPPPVSDKLVPDASEPRRSSRIIQPTSRLLEGLQSSMMMSRDPTSSPEKSSKKRRIRGSSSSGISMFKSVV